MISLIFRRERLNFNLLNRCFEKLFEKNIGLAMRLTSTNEFESIKEIILLFLNSHQDYKMNKKWLNLC